MVNNEGQLGCQRIWQCSYRICIRYNFSDIDSPDTDRIFDGYLDTNRISDGYIYEYRYISDIK
jgi:hypothetical protein